MTQIQVMLTEDHGLVRQGIRKILESEQSITVLGEAGSGQELLRQVKDDGLRPDVVLMDIKMPKMSGVDATRKLCKMLPDVAVVGLTAEDQDDLIAQMLDAGACGYVLKDTTPEDLVDKIKLAANKKTAIDADVLKRLRKYNQYNDVQKQAINRMSTGEDALTRRELDVMHQLMGGYSNKEIANHLCISERTVQTHLSNIFSKMEVNSRTEAVLTALKEGLLVVA